MKYKLLRFSLLSMLVMLFGGFAYAQDDPAVTLDFTSNDWGLPVGSGNGATASTEFTNSQTSQKITLYATTKYYFNNDGYLMLGKSGSTLTLPAFDFDVEKIEVEGKSGASGDVKQNIYVGENAASTETKGAKTTNTYEIASEFQAAGNIYQLKVTSAHNTQISKILIYKKDDGGGGGAQKTATTVTLSEGYATSGVVGGTIDLPTATVKAGDTPIDALVTWTSSNETVAKIEGSTINLLAAGTAKITASYAGDDANEASSASFTVTVNGVYTSLKALQEAVTSTSTPAQITFNNVFVTAVTTNNAYLADADGYGALLYTKNHGLEAGQVLNGTITANIILYRGQTEITDFSKEGLTITTTTLTPTEKTIDQITAANQSTLVTLKGVTYADGKLTDGTNSITFYNTFGIADESLPVADKTYDITGIVIVYNTTLEFAPRTAADIVEKAAEAGYVYRDFAVNLTNADAIPTTSNSFGVKVAADGTYNAVAADDATANFIVNANSFNGAQHGWVNCVFTIPVQGAVKIELGDCQYGAQNGTIVDAAGNSTEIKANASKACWAAGAPHDKVVVAYYAGTEATTLTITYNGYCPFIAVTSIDPSEIPSDATLTYSIGETGAEGVVPVAQKVEIGSKVKVPANTTLFVEGKTLTAWTDGTNRYKAGDEVTVDADLTLTPIFTDNTVTFADRTTETTLVWQFGEGNGAGTLNAQGKKTFLVTQATIGEAVIDVKMDIDATNGKINNVGRSDEWAQCNDGTILTIPAYKGTAVSFRSYSDATGTTIGGVEATDKAATYTGTAETLDIVAKGMGYISNVTAVYPVPSGEEPVKVDVNVSYSIDDIECQGNILPAGGTYAAGDEYTIPAQNFTLFMEGHTLTGWSDGTNVYAAGEKITLPNENIVLAPVFTKNEVSLADRTEPVTVKWNFRPDQGAPKVGWEGQDNLIWVAQAEVNGKTIDVALPFSTAPGKFNNKNNTDWVQINSGTKFTVPSCKGATVSMEAYNEITTTTIDGQTDYTSGKTISYTIAGAAETVDVVIGDGSYYRYIQVVLPVVQSQGGGQTYTNEAAKVVWPFTDPSNISSYTATPNDVFSTVAANVGDLTLTGTGTGQAKYPDGSTVTFAKLKPAGSTTAVEWAVKPAAGLTFTPTKISAYIIRFGTDAENGITITAKAGNGETITLGNFTAPRNNKSQADDKFGKNSNYTNQFVIELTAEQQTALTSADGLSVFGTIGVGSTKEGGYAEVTIEGLVNGTAAQVEKYTLTTAVAPEEAGSVTKYPNADEYESGSEVTLTATENFGYDFVNWTNAAGEEVSTEAKFKYIVNSNETLTANFKAVETYELALTVDGTNDYMVTVSPAPTVVDGKNMYEAGTAVQLTANQYEGLVTFTNWSDGETASDKIVKMDGNVTLTAMYAEADIIAGWDFYKKGGEGRKADFAAQDNDADALSLVNTETGETSGWLDKSTEAANGYESFKGAAVNWRTGASNGDVGNWHWQTKVNAEAFTDIKVQFQMLYNYNAYQTYNAEYSLDGENWTKFGDITMTGTKSPAEFNETLPEAANNQKDLYIRMIADKTSNVDGASSANDGNTLAMFFITGTPKLVDDGKAPELVSTVPANKATGASATGKIVLTFDERVKMAEGAVAYINNTAINSEMQNPTKGIVSGKTITFEYKGLEYATQYAFILAGNTVADMTDNFIAEPIELEFTTMERPTVTKGLYDQVVSTADELVAAIDAAQKRADKNVRYRIFIKNGEYTIPLSSTKKTVNGYEVPECITFINTQNLSLIGESRDGVIITNGIDKNETFAGTYGTTSKYDGIGNSDVFQISGSDYYFQDLTIESGMDDATGRDLAVQDKATRTIYKNTGLRGYQDTWTSNNDNGLYYFEGGYVRGRTDYMCGKGDAFFNGVEIRQIAGGYAAVPSKSIKYGYVYKDCTINGEGDGVDGNYTLGRPWGQGTPVALWIDTKMNVVPSAIGWNEMSGGWPKRFAEYNSTTSTGSVIDLSGRKKIFADTHENNPVLTAEEALEAGNLHNMFGEWDPTLLTEQAPIPANVKLTGTTLTWDDSNYALLYAIVKDGKVIGFTTEATFTVDDATATYAVRAANEMGGLGEAAEAVVATGIEEIAPATTTADGKVYNLQGIRVDKAQKGLYIINGKKVVIK